MTDLRGIRQAVPGELRRAVLYTRVSTGRQADTDLSIPDQRRQLHAWCSSHDYHVVAEYIEAGASATDDKRPEFQRMIEAVTAHGDEADVIVVHSYSRFFRDSFGLEFYLRKLAKAGVRLVSITQEFNDASDPAQAMMRKVIALFDEYQSRENAKHVLRSMKENARQGFWNGSRPPFGYRVEVVDQRGARVKKRLAVDEVEAELVHLVFRLFLEGHDGSGPMGVKAIASWLNANGYRTRQGAVWAVGTVHTMLTNTTYGGVARFNKIDSRTRTRKSVSEHVTAAAPVIIAPSIFEDVQALLKARNPKVNPPRVVTGPILLTGLAVCATCSGAMTLRTGTSSSGKVHKYYTCTTCARKGKSVCKGRSIAMARLDHLVTRHLIERLLAPDRLAVMLAALAARRAERTAAVDERIAALVTRAEEADERLRRMYKVIEDGTVAVDDLIKDRITALKAARETAHAALARAHGANEVPIEICHAQIVAFGDLMRKQLTTGDIAFRKAYLGAIIDRVEVDDDQIRIRGRKDVLEQAVLANGGPVPGVRSFVRRWRARKDSNL